MTTRESLPPKQRPLLDELEAIGSRLESGSITPDEADALGAGVMQRLNAQIVEDVDAELRQAAKARRIQAMILVAAIMAATALLFLLL